MISAAKRNVNYADLNRSNQHAFPARKPHSLRKKNISHKLEASKNDSQKYNSEFGIIFLIIFLICLICGSIFCPQITQITRIILNLKLKSLIPNLYYSHFFNSPGISTTYRYSLPDFMITSF
jgi:hypothetical protein